VLDFIAASNDGILASIMASKEWINFAGQNDELVSEITGCPRIALTLPSFDVMQQKKFCNPKVFLSSIYFRL
jgi:hypothetical protein